VTLIVYLHAIQENWSPVSNPNSRFERPRTLTDEFLWAARLSGSFTRWEVLKLIKAGFKHAFIDKRDAQELKARHATSTGAISLDKAMLRIDTRFFSLSFISA
jgi:hypothetical protein